MLNTVNLWYITIRFHISHIYRKYYYVEIIQEGHQVQVSDSDKMCFVMSFQKSSKEKKDVFFLSMLHVTMQTIQCILMRR